MIATPTLTLEQWYGTATHRLTAVLPHLALLRRLARECQSVVEFGVSRGVSSAAWLLECPRVLSYDVATTPEALQLHAIVGDRWDYRIADSRTATIPETDLIFFDSLHTYPQVYAEVMAHGERSRKYLVFHDVTTFGEVAANGATGAQAWWQIAGESVPREFWGIRPAIDQFQIAHPWWGLKARIVESHGLLVLERRGHGPS